MTKTEYYETIEKYNQIIADRQFSPMTHPAEELLPLQEQLRGQVKKMIDILVLEQELHHRRYGISSAEIEGKVRLLYGVLQDLDSDDKSIVNYEGTYISNMTTADARMLIMCVVVLIGSVLCWLL